MVKLKSILNNPKLWQVLTTALLGYFGYEQVQQTQSSHDVDVEVVIPTQQPHTHPTHSHKTWDKDISDAIENAKKEHKDKFH